jgi:AraC-like DNA-binding protein
MREFLATDILNTIPHESVVIASDLALTFLDSTPTVCTNLEKIEQASIIVCLSGHSCVKVNLEQYEVEAPSLMTLMPGQIIEPQSTSANFSAIAITLSKRFIDMINLPGWQKQYMDLYNNPISPLDDKQMRMMCIFFTILHHAASNRENPYRLQVIENLIRVFYYGGIGSRLREESTPTYKNTIVERFLELTKEHYREERLIGFYADKLCITPKYLSKVVKEHTGRSAGEWIERHVILEARAMLQSSDMTIQQISASLNFPNQSFFGKYFKRATGLSPKQYRNKR